MGQTNSIFIYSPLDFVEYKDKHPNEPKKLESFLCSALHGQYNIISNDLEIIVEQSEIDEQ